MLPRLLALVLAALAALAACAAPAADGSIRVRGDVASPAAWTAQELERRFADDVRVVEHVAKSGERTRLRAVPLRALVDASTPRFDAARKNHALAFAVVLRSRDGYAVAYALEEVAPFRREPELYLAFATADGALDAQAAPARLVHVGGQGGARTPHGIVAVDVVDLAR